MKYANIKFEKLLNYSKGFLYHSKRRGVLLTLPDNRQYRVSFRYKTKQTRRKGLKHRKTK